ncbi:MAG: protein TolQ [Gammaproteobacteria bacterium]|nr:protein TolQ [Gammaproteobacteria bacterium]
MNGELSIIELFLGASLLVKLVMFILLMASVASWVIIFEKWLMLRRARANAKIFEERFWSGIDLVDLYRQLSKEVETLEGLPSIFTAGFGEFARLRKQEGADPMSIVEGAQRAMRVAMSREAERVESRVAFLATVGSTSPYIGLFGTVWGIMNSFRALGGSTQATLSMVAPGIAEALIATAMGLFAAIPAVIAYNRYSHSLDRIENQMETFNDEFSSLLQRQAYSR